MSPDTVMRVYGNIIRCLGRTDMRRLRKRLFLLKHRTPKGTLRWYRRRALLDTIMHLGSGQTLWWRRLLLLPGFIPGARRVTRTPDSWIVMESPSSVMSYPRDIHALVYRYRS